MTGEQSPVDAKFHGMWFTPSRAAAMVGLTEKDLLKKASDIGLGEYHMKKERCFDMKAAWGVTSNIFIKCESSRLPSGRMPDGWT